MSMIWYVVISFLNVVFAGISSLCVIAVILYLYQAKKIGESFSLCKNELIILNLKKAIVFGIVAYVLLLLVILSSSFFPL